MVLPVTKVGEPTRKWALKISRLRIHVHRLQSGDKGFLNLLGPPPALEVLCARMCGRSEARVPRHAVRTYERKELRVPVEGLAEKKPFIAGLQTMNVHTQS